MEFVLEWLAENASDLAIFLAVILCKVFGKQKTAEELQAKLEKKEAKNQAKLEKKVSKQSLKLETCISKLENFKKAGD